MVNKFINKMVLKKQKKQQCPNKVGQQTREENKVCSNSSVTSIKAKLVCLIKSQPEGIPLESLAGCFEKMYSKKLTPQQYNCGSMTELMTKFRDIIDHKSCPTSKKAMVTLAQGSSEAVDADPRSQQELNAEVMAEVMDNKVKELRNKSVEHVEVFRKILESYGGMCIIDNLPEEYEHRTNRKLIVKELGFNSLLQLITSLGEDFDIKVLQNGQHILLLRSDSLVEDERIATYQEDPLLNPSGSKFPKETRDRVMKLLTEFYPDGLQEGEINGAYKGMFGEALRDLDPLTYGISTIAQMFEDETTVVKSVWRKNCLFFVTPNTHQLLSESVFEDEEEETVRKKMSDSLPPEVVKRNEKFHASKLSDIVREGDSNDVVGGDCFSPERFYVTLHSSEHSDALDNLSNNMSAFYKGDMKFRYAVPDDLFVARYPMAFYYQKDNRYYRGIIISWEDLENMKVYLVDYGNEFSTTKENAFLLHREFFKLPPQAIKAQLYGIKPPDGKDFYLRRYSLPFYEMIVDQVFTIHIHKIENNSLIVTAFQVPQKYKSNQGTDDSVRTEENTININYRLVELKCAVFKDEPGVESGTVNVNNSMLSKLIEPPTKVDSNEESVAEQHGSTLPEVESQVVLASLAQIEPNSDVKSNNVHEHTLKDDLPAQTSRFCSFAKKCLDYQNLINDSSESSSQASTRCMTPMKSDIPSFKTYLTNGISDRYSSSSPKTSKSSSFYEPNHLRLNSISPVLLSGKNEEYELSAAAPAYIPISCSFKNRSHTIEAENGKNLLPRTSSLATFQNSIDTTSLMGRQLLPSEELLSEYKDDLLLPVQPNCSMVIRHVVRRVHISNRCDIRVFRADDDEWYMALNELQHLILEDEKLQTVLEVMEAHPTTNKIEITFQTHPDVFMMLTRYGAEYLFTKDQTILTKLQMTNFNVILPMMEQFYPDEYALLESLRDAKHFLARPSIIQSETLNHTTSEMRLRNVPFLEDSSSETPPAPVNINVRSTFPNLSYRAAERTGPPLAQPNWETHSMTCASGGDPAGLRRSYSNTLIPPNFDQMPYLIRGPNPGPFSYPNVPHQPPHNHFGYPLITPNNYLPQRPMFRPCLPFPPGYL